VRAQTQAFSRTFPYVLICSLFGMIVSLGSVWVSTAVAFSPVISA